MVTINLRGATGTQWLHSFTLRVARVCTIYQLKREWASEGPVYTPHGEMYDHCPHIDCLPSSVRGRGTDAEEGSNGGWPYQMLDTSPDCLQPLTFILSDFSD